MAGSLKLFTPIAELATSLPWAAQVPEGLVRFIGAAAVSEGDRLAVLDATGRLHVHAAQELAGAGSIADGRLTGVAVSIGVIPAENTMRASA